LEQQAEKYLKFAAMIATSMVVMFLLMYLNTYELSHVHWSQTRFYMTFIMGGAMAIVMLLFMLGMYRNKAVNIGILLVGAAMIIGALFLVRTQTPIADKSYMRAMIPHHSIAILTSEQAHIRDARVRELADGIIKAQRKEIKEMEWLIEDIRKNGAATTQAEAQARPVPDFEGRLNPQQVAEK